MQMNKTDNTNLSRFINSFINYLILFILGFLVLVVFLNVIFRYFLHSSIDWSEEMSRFLLIWLVFIGGASAFSNNEHMKLDALLNILPERLFYVVRLAGDLIIFLMSIFMTFGGYGLMSKNLDWLSPVTRIPYGYVYAIIPICFAIISVISVLDIIRKLKEIKTKRNNGEN